MMEHKHLKMIAIALIAGGLLYFGMQYYRQNHDDVKIQSGGMQQKMQQMKQQKQQQKQQGGGQQQMPQMPKMQ